VIRKIIGLAFIIFGLIGLGFEISNYNQQGSLEVFAVLLACIFIITGLLITYFKRVVNFKKDQSPHQGIFLIITTIIELLVGAIILIFIFILGYQGFLAGEMGTMIGFFSLASLLIIFPYLLLKTLMIYGLLKKKKWAIYLSFLFVSIYILIGLLLITELLIISIILLIYAVFSLRSSLSLLQNYNN